jgi:hypothetical protein
MVSITKSSTGCGAPREPCCERKYAAVFVRQLCARFPLFVTPFPQQKITRATSIRLGGEYYCFQRKRDLPEGESGLTDVFENRQRDSVQATGNGRKWESSYSECDRRRVRQKHGLLLVGAERFRDNKSCDLEPNRISENRNRGGEISQEKSPSRFCALRAHSVITACPRLLRAGRRCFQRCSPFVPFPEVLSARFLAARSSLA